MTLKEEREKKVKILQKNLKNIRKIAGWSMQQLADQIGVTKQTVNNWENENNPTPMNFTQYIAIRAVIDCEVKENKNELLGEVVTLLLDTSDGLNEEEYKKLKKQLDIFFAASGGLTLKCFLDTVGPTLATLKASGVALPILGAAGTAALGPLGIIGGAAALTSGWWLKELLKKKKK